MKTYLIRIATSLSQLLNALLGGHPDRTVSARAYLESDRLGWHIVYRTINTVFFWQKDHCFESHLADIDFAKEVLNVRR